MSHTYDFLGVGGLAVDWAMQVERLPLADDKYPAALTGKLPGGFIANATCAAAQLGLRAGYAGWIGDDADGALLRDDFLRWGVDPAGLVRVPGAVTPFTVVVADAAGGRAILLPDSPLYHADLTPAQRALAGKARVVYTYPRDVAWCAALDEAARAGGGALALDVESAAPLRGADLRDAVRRAAVAFIAADALHAMGARSLAEIVAPGQWLIQTRGAAGAVGIVGGAAEPVSVPARPVPVVDSTGAGDCFHAAALYAWLDGADLREALTFASAAASLAVQGRGARGGLPAVKDVRAVLESG